MPLAPRDLSPYRRSNCGVDYVHRFDSGRPGPHLLVNALTHGNEFCGMVAATHLLDHAVRPAAGVLTVSFANVAAYESFDPSRPLASRQLVHNLNRIWSAEWLDGPHDSPELRRARALRPVVEAADHVLDLHSTSADVEPFWVYGGAPRHAAAAAAIGMPGVHLRMPQGLSTGTPLIAHGGLGAAQGHRVGLVAECGQHFLERSGAVAVSVALRFLAHFGVLDARTTQAMVSAMEPQTVLEQGAVPGCAPVRRFELLSVHLVRTREFQFVRPLQGFESFQCGDLIARDGAHEIRAPEGGCTVFMPTREPIVGREAVYLTRPV